VHFWSKNAYGGKKKFVELSTTLPELDDWLLDPGREGVEAGSQT